MQKYHEMKTDKKIKGFCGLSENDTIVMFDDENLLFSLPNKKFV